jgi:hypothetical protein
MKVLQYDEYTHQDQTPLAELATWAAGELYAAAVVVCSARLVLVVLDAGRAIW